MSVLKQIEVSDIFRRYRDVYKKKYASSIQVNQLNTIRSIEICRTAELGGHIDQCDHCGIIRISYNSCRNRHCPKCQSLPAEKWIKDRSEEILPTHYFHVVFTIPGDLNDLIFSNQQIGYSILFKAASQTLLELTSDQKYLGAQVGIIAILHTWGQNLMFHPHVHFLITGGGLSEDKQHWIPTAKNFLLPVKVMSMLFRGKFLAYLEEEFSQRKLRKILSDGSFQAFIRALRCKKWVVYCKPPIRNPETVIEYFGRYTHRVAISNRRIKKLEKGQVYFKWKDYSDKNKIKIMSLDAIEFIRRFLLHVLPHKFVKIRYYGLYGNRNRKAKIERCQSLLGAETKIQSTSNSKKKSWQELLFDLTRVDINICPVCKKGTMEFKETILPLHNTSPPQHNFSVA